jgi:NADH dehydrogenase [ubiquinone] 1 alpha subcomplex assembly factor 1
LGEVRRLVDFDDTADFAAWQPIDDVVMGGVSRSSFRQAAPGIASFSGLVSRDYGGGFASVRTKPQAWATGGAESFMLHCRGDGRQYKFTMRTDDGFDGVQYQVRFAPPRSEWTTVVIPVTEFAASFRGRPVPGAPPLDPAHVRQLGLMISDQQAGPFELLVDWIDVALTRAAPDLSR